MTNPIDRSIPDELVELTRLALTSELDGVSLGFEGLGADFPAPIGWMLHLTRVETVLAHTAGIDERDNYLMITARPDESVSAFVSADGGTYLGVDEIAAWIREARPEIQGEEALAAMPADAHADDADRIIEAVRNGWSASRSLRRHDWILANKVSDTPQSDLPIMAAYEYNASNNFYNVEGHEAHRSTGAPVSETIGLGRYLIAQETQWIYARHGRERIKADEALDIVAQKAPWFAEVACYDDELDDWVL